MLTRQFFLPLGSPQITVRESGNTDTDRLAVEDLIRQYRKEKGSSRVVVGRGLGRGDVGVVDLVCTEKGSSLGPLPGLDKRKLTFDTEVDPLGGCGWAGWGGWMAGLGGGAGRVAGW